MYNFDKILERKGTSSFKWDFLQEVFGTHEVLPMWVADMDFESPKEVIDVLVKRAKHGVFGYTFRPETYYTALINWLNTRYNWKVEKEWMMHSPGIVTAINLAIQTFSEKGDNILIQTPVYYPFHSSVINNERELITSELVNDNGYYRIDFNQLEKDLSQNVKLMIFCSPHNPVGRVWTKEELIKVSDLCLKYNVILLSDEIHADLTFPGVKHTVSSSLGEKYSQNTITCFAPSKTFNIAGLTTSTIIIPNKELRDKLQVTMRNVGLSIGNIFGIEAMEKAYTYGGEWLDELKNYIFANYKYTVNFFEKRMPKIKPTKSDGTYLIWLDCSELGLNSNELKDFMIYKAKLGFDNGIRFGENSGNFMRMNIGCSRLIIEKALTMLEEAVDKL